MALAHHHAPERDENRRAKPELLGAEKRGDRQIASGLELPVHLHDNPVAQVVCDEALLRFGQTEFPRQPDVLDRRERRRAGAAVVA